MGKYCCGCSGRYGKCVACTCVQANKLCVDCRPGEIFRCANKALASSQPCRSVSPVPMASHAASQPTESMRDSPSLPLTALAPASSRPYLENSAIDDLLMSCRNPDRTQRHPDRTQRHSRTHRHDPPPAPTRAQSEDAHLAGGTVAAESQSEDALIAGGTVAAESQDPSSETEELRQALKCHQLMLNCWPPLRTRYPWHTLRSATKTRVSHQLMLNCWPPWRTHNPWRSPWSM